MSKVAMEIEDRFKGWNNLGSEILFRIYALVGKDDRPAFRQACTSWRMAVDGNATKASINLGPKDLALSKHGQLPYLGARLLKLSTFRLQLELGQDVAVEDAVLLATQLFLRLSPEARQRITRLELVQAEEDAVPSAQKIVQSLVGVLPGLRELDLLHFLGMAYWERSLLQLYDSLEAGLPQLKQLSLPSSLAVRGIETLTDKGIHLERLHVHGETEDEELQPSVVYELSDMSGLQELHLSNCRLDERMAEQFLLDSLPESLKRLQLDECYTPWFRSLHGRLDAGRLVAVELLDCEGGRLDVLLAVGRLLSKLARGGQPQEPPLGELRIYFLTLSGVQQLSAEQLQGLRELRGWFCRSQIKDSLQFDWTASTVFKEVVQLLGLPERLYFDTESWVRFCIHPKGTGPRSGNQQQQLQPPAATTAAGALPAPSMPSAAAELMSHVVSRLSPGGASLSGAAAAAAELPAPVCGSERYLLVRGPAAERARMEELLEDAGVDRRKECKSMRTADIVYFALDFIDKRAAAVKAAVELRVRERGLEASVAVLQLDARHEHVWADCYTVVSMEFQKVLGEVLAAMKDPADPSSSRPQMELLVRLQQQLVV
ncbi:hypothetical protein Agub_g6189 [Astrephomene gubernaculifera]|uniref:Uncharacterized protein n=1 Tax=Astrephomene gubernaculifera TaxID=47775 RepID=A0AAD3DMZ3_9CHLO|nr:hypothetical protein Agub_g6189 [Astrephomene gubernaculifera]